VKLNAGRRFPAGRLAGWGSATIARGLAQRAIGGTFGAGGRRASGVLIGHDTAFPGLWLRQAVDLVQCRHAKAVDYAAQTFQVNGSAEPAIRRLVLMRERHLVLMGARLAPSLVNFNSVTYMLRSRWHGKPDHRRRCEQQRQEQS
jgi:hypothetical protein